MRDSTKLPLRTWFLATCLISKDKTELSWLVVKRLLGTSYRTAWLVHHKLIATMAAPDATQPLSRSVQIDDAYLGGEKPGTVGRADPAKVPIVAAASTNDSGNPVRIKLSAVAGSTREAVPKWARANLLPGCDVRSDGLSCFAGVIDTGCAHSLAIVGNRKPLEPPQFTPRGLISHAATSQPTRERQIRGVAEVYD